MITHQQITFKEIRQHLAKLDRAKLRQQKLNSQSREQNKVKKEKAIK